MVEYPFTVDGVDFRAMVERDSYATTLTPLYTTVLTTMDGRDHRELIRLKSTLSLRLNPQTAEDTARVCNALLRGPVSVLFHCLQRDVDVYATMVADGITAQHLSRCRYRGQNWNEMQTITLTEM